MATQWFTDRWEIAVDNPGYGELLITAPTSPYHREPLVDETWQATLKGVEIGSFLALVTERALDLRARPDGGRWVDADGWPYRLPEFVTPAAARDLLPGLQRAAVETVAVTEQYERSFQTEDTAGHYPAAPYCVVCGEGGRHTRPGRSIPRVPRTTTSPSGTAQTSAGRPRSSGTARRCSGGNSATRRPTGSGR